MSLITANNLSKSFGDTLIFGGVSFQLPPQARVAIVGANGIGKTTLLEVLITLLQALALVILVTFLAGGRKEGDEDVKSHFRKGAPGDWINHFSADHKALFKSLYPDLVVKLGYEASDDW